MTFRTSASLDLKKHMLSKHPTKNILTYYRKRPARHISVSIGFRYNFAQFIHWRISKERCGHRHKRADRCREIVPRLCSWRTSLHAWIQSTVLHWQQSDGRLNAILSGSCQDHLEHWTFHSCCINLFCQGVMCFPSSDTPPAFSGSWETILSPRVSSARRFPGCSRSRNSL